MFRVILSPGYNVVCFLFCFVCFLFTQDSCLKDLRLICFFFLARSKNRHIEKLLGCVNMTCGPKDIKTNHNTNEPRRFPKLVFCPVCLFWAADQPVFAVPSSSSILPFVGCPSISNMLYNFIAFDTTLYQFYVIL